MNNKRRRFLGVIGGGLLAANCTKPNFTPVQILPATSQDFSRIFEQKMREIEAQSGGRMGVALLLQNNANDERIYHYRGDEKFPMCSTFKLILTAFILQMYDENKISLEKPIEINATDIVSNSPVCRENIGKTLKIHELCHATMTTSDNCAANLLIHQLGGIGEFNKRLKDNWDIATRLDRLEPDLNTATNGDVRDTTSPNAMMMNLYHFLEPNKDKVFLTQSSKEIFRNWLLANQTGGQSLKKFAPNDWVIGDKTGAGENNTVNDVAFFVTPNNRKIYVAAYINGAKDEFPTNKQHLAQIGKFIFDNFS